MLGPRPPRRWPAAALPAAVLAVVLVLAACVGGGGKDGTGGRTSPGDDQRVKRPNIVYILADDLSWDLLDYMPNVKRLQKRVMTFSNYFVSDTLCCPSRATILTGKYPHNTGVRSNDPPKGGFQVFRDRGNERDTFAVSLQKAGYRTALMGKYLNGYETTKEQGSSRTYVPPGWTEWQVTGLGYANYNYRLNSNGILVHHGRLPKDYLTSVISAKGVDFINRAVHAARAGDARA